MGTGRIKGFKHSEETKRRISNSNMGKIISLETRKKFSDAKKGTISPMRGKHHTEEARLKNRLAHLGKLSPMKGKKHTKETIKKIILNNGMKGKIPWNKGKPWSEELKQKMSRARIGRFNGEKHPNWKGGITPLNHLIRNSMEYKLWRKAVFQRDYWTCIWCKYKGKNIQADHIKPFADYPELRFAIDNGRTLCVECHKKTDSWGGKRKKLISN